MLKLMYNKITSGKYIAWYFIGVMLFPYLFNAIKSYYIKDLCTCPHPIDVHPMEAFDFFNKDYVLTAKKSCYNIPHYYYSFFILDIIFPLVYTLFFLSINKIWKKTKKYHYFRVIIFAGFLFDYLENIFFAYFLQAGDDNLSSPISFFSTIKSFLFIANMIVALSGLVKLITKGGQDLVGN